MFISLQNLLFTGFVSCLADLFSLRQRDISYHARIDLSSTFLNFFRQVFVMIREVPGAAYFLYPHVPEDQSDTTKCAKNKYPCCQSNRR